jgi:glycosyltransferase involved in cell wall biosynthesis
MKSQDLKDISIRLDILGQGELIEECQKASQESKLPVQIRLLGVVSYGAQLFELMRQYHAIVLPIVSDEQPRIVYDAYSQGIPVLGSSTDGIKNCVQDGITGKLIPPNDPIALANLLKWSFQNLDQLEMMGLKAIEVASSLTHQEMHRQRWKILSTTLSQAKHESSKR